VLLPSPTQSASGVQGTQTFTIIAGISNDIQTFGTPVIVTTDGFLGVATSSARFKDQIKPMEKASEALFKLNPVTFRYKRPIDPAGTAQFGLVAEEVEKVNPDLVVRDKEGKPYSVRYEQVNAMLLNEFLKEHRTVQELKSTAAKQEANAAKQEAIIAHQQKQIEALTAGLQKVSAQIEASKPAPQVVKNND
jgi:trimeric autotransporter adhesin